MPSIQQELDSFTKFAQEKIQAGTAGASMDELYDQWRELHASSDDALAIAASLRDMEKGVTGREFSSFADEFRLRHGLPPQQ